MQEIDVKIKRKLPFGEGVYGICYVTEDGDVFKKFKDIPKTKSNYASIKKLLDVRSGLYVFPKKIVYNKRTIAGVIYPLIHSESLYEKDLDYDKLICGVDFLYEETNNLSDQRVSSFDIRRPNILYDDSFKIIDTDMYLRANYFLASSLYELSIENIRKMNKGMCDVIGLESTDNGCIIPNGVGKFVSSHKHLFDDYRFLTESSSYNAILKEFLIELRDELNESLGMDVKKCSDVRRLLRK